jgi:hypothetical protein
MKKLRTVDMKDVDLNKYSYSGDYRENFYEFIRDSFTGNEISGEAVR